MQGRFYGKSDAYNKVSCPFAVFNELTCVAAVYALLVLSLRDVDRAEAGPGMCTPQH